MADIYRVALEDGYWKVLKDGAKRALRRFDSRQEAVDYANEFARGHRPCELFLHRQDDPITLRYRFE